MSIVRNILVFVGTILAVGFFPILVIPILISGIWRQIVSLLAKIIRPEFKGLVHHASSFWAGDLDRVPAKANIGACVVLVEKVTRDELVAALNQSLVPDKTSKNGIIPYPELAQYPTNFMGYSFWMDEPEFDLRSHITEISTVITEEELPEVTTSVLSNDPWPPRTSPWKLILYSNLILPGNPVPVSAIIMSFHHCLGDAEGIGQALKLVNETVQMAEPFPVVTLGQVLTLPYTLIKNYVWSYDLNSLHLPAAKLSTDRNSAFLFKRVSFGKLDSRKFPQDISEETLRTSIILTGVAGGIRRFMTSRGIEIPEILHCFQPLFLPRDGIKFKNCGSLAFQRLFTGTADTFERLDKTTKYLHWHKTSILPWAYHMSYNAIGVLPRSWQKVIVRSWQATGVYTEDHFPRKDYTVCKKKARILEFHNMAGPMPGTSGIFVYVSIFKDEVGLRLSISESICPKKSDVNEILHDVVQEIKTIIAAKSI